MPREASTPRRLDASARTELLHEVQYYETARAGTGVKFRIAVDEVFVLIKHSPKAGKSVEEGCRRIRIAGFPFSVVYREEPTEIVVYAIRPDAREPGYWVQRAR